MAVVAAALALWTIYLDENGKLEYISSWVWIFTGGVESATAILQTIAGSMITIAGVVFSLTLVTLSLASSNFGPRLLRHFMRDLGTQIVLGTFIATFLYCLLVLRSLRRGDASFIPHLSVTLGIVFALLSLWVLIFFIHHVALSIQADEIIARISREINQAIDRLFPHRLRKGDDSGENNFDIEATATPWKPLLAPQSGYLQTMDVERLLEIALSNDLFIKGSCRSGQFLVERSLLIEVKTEGDLDEALKGKLLSCFTLGERRIPTQDFQFNINQLVEIAVRALSPGINDPFTAITCIDRIGSAFCALADRDMSSQHRLEYKQNLRLSLPALSFEESLAATFRPIRQCGNTSFAVTHCLIAALKHIALATEVLERRLSVRRCSDEILESMKCSSLLPVEKQLLELAYQEVISALKREDTQ